MASIDPRTWTDKRGRQRTHYRVQIRRVGFPTVTKTFKRRTDARAWARNTEADIERGLHFPNHEAEKRTLAALVERQLEHVKLHRPDDYERQDATLNWWKGKLGDYTLAAITIKPDLLADARDELTKEGLSPATVNRYMAALSAGFTNAVKEWRWMRENPMRNISKLKEPKGRVRFLSDEERGRLFDACRKSAYSPLYLMVLFSITTGMRRGELLGNKRQVGLRWQDIDLERRDKEGTPAPIATLKHTKNGDTRSVPVIPEVVTLLRAHGKVRKLGNDKVFCPDGSTEVNDFDQAWYAALKAAKVKDFRWHDLRHCAASYVAMSHGTLPEIAALLGHRTLQMVKRYAHLTDQHVGEVVERMTKKYFQ